MKFLKIKRSKSSTLDNVELDKDKTPKISNSSSCPEKFQNLGNQVAETRNEMKITLDKVIENQENLDGLLTRSRTLSNSAENMKKLAKKVKNRQKKANYCSCCMCCRGRKTMIVIIIFISVVISICALLLIIR